jgi:hypothetical protein
MERRFEFKPEFKTLAMEALSKLSFSQVHGVMSLIKREGYVYTEAESNAIVGFLGEMKYSDVAHIFEAMPSMVSEVKASEDGPMAEAPLSVETEA